MQIQIVEAKWIYLDLHCLLRHGMSCSARERLSFTILWANSADDILKYFSYFSQKTGFDISCKLHEISNPFRYEKNINKNISICRLLNFFTQSPKLLKNDNVIYTQRQHTSIEIYTTFTLNIRIVLSEQKCRPYIRRLRTRRLIRVYTICHIIQIKFYTHHKVVKWTFQILGQVWYGIWS